ncbi:MAG: hypothetical protein Fur0025_48650 [Oscillatoriaceae cyanobacterium]
MAVVLADISQRNPVGQKTGFLGVLVTIATELNQVFGKMGQNHWPHPNLNSQRDNYDKWREGRNDLETGGSQRQIAIFAPETI